MDIILKYFPKLTETQVAQFKQCKTSYEDWNSKINVISRKDMDNFYERHVLHSLAITKVMRFNPGAEVLDIGTGGGFPGIPLAIMFPETKFTLVDSIGKKITVVNNVAVELGLTNVTGIHERAEKIKHKFDFVVSRAVTTMPEFMQWAWGKFKEKSVHPLPNGILYLKGGDLTAELEGLRNFHKEYNISEFFEEEFFETKKVVWVKCV
ncbi:MAG TPA: 16S rRNA (guanine(527)-N(7))-methyltransferase RsmG [Flavobacteriales bacterium]|nr:16S rRNA (guanine(527)-N(7))-methyltransferase RsmG [Flavobacteriales bacterium]